MKDEAGNLRPGNLIEYEGSKFKVIEADHVKPGKGGAFMRTILQNIERKQKKEITFRVEEKIEFIQIYEHSATLLYKDSIDYVFLCSKTLEEYRFANPSDPEFIPEGGEAILLIDENDNVISVTPPKTVICTVEITNGNLPGQSASAQEKSATLTNGVIIKVPQYVKEGDKIKINTERMAFVSKA